MASNCRNRIDNTIDSDALRDLAEVLNVLMFLSNRVPIRQLLSLPSIERRLSNDRRLSVEVLASDEGK